NQRMDGIRLIPRRLVGGFELEHVCCTHAGFLICCGRAIISGPVHGTVIPVHYRLTVHTLNFMEISRKGLCDY
ncbi:MAG TPA: hypothetical protein PLN94_18700, partial [Thiolinea sp.]|nr:hypothetical protein [Thiolinea sp.]